MFDRDRCAVELRSLASQGILLGTSSWKYPGWEGRLYDRARYTYRGRYSERRFETRCLAEYAEVFATVSVDAAYYRFPDAAFCESLISQVPAGFRFALKVTGDITLKRFPRLPRFGTRAGAANPLFLDAERFAEGFLAPWAAFRESIGLLMFEFSHFHASEYERGRDFVADLEAFLARLPADWPYGVEIRNRSFLQPQYFEVLRRHGVTHIYNQWAEMPEIREQMSLTGSRTTLHRAAARFLLKCGRPYEQAVRLFKPYDRLREPHPSARAAGAALIRAGQTQPGGTRTFIYVNNRLEGNALDTIAAMLEQARPPRP